MYSKEGYRRNSPDKNNPYNIIPSGTISMKNVDHPVLGIDEYGNMQWMMPGEDYQFPGSTVLEIPYMQGGGANNASGRTAKIPTTTTTTTTKNNIPYQWSDSPVNTTPLAIPSAYTTTQGKSDSGSAHVDPIQEQLRLANLWRNNNLDSKYEQELRTRYGVSPQEILYKYDPTYAQEMANTKAQYNIGDASLNPNKIQYSSTDLRRGDNIAPNTEWMYPNLTGQTRAGMTTQANQDLAFDIMGSGMANQYFKPNSTLNTLLQDGLKATYYKKAPWTWKPDPDNYYRLGKKETILEDVIKTGKISARNDTPTIVARSERFPGLQIKQKTFPEADTYWSKGIPLDQKYGPKNQYYGKYLIEASDDIPFIAAKNQTTKQKGFWDAPDVNYNNTHIEGQYVKPRQSYAYDELGEIKPSIGTPLKYNTTDFKLLEPHWFYGYKEYKPKLQQGGTAGMDGMIKARLAIDSHFGNPTARRITNYDTRSYEFSDGNKGNVYVSSYDNLVTPQIQDVNGKLIFVDNPWNDENADRSYEQSMKFERPEDAKYFGENYKKYAPMMNLYKKQQGGEMNEEIIKKIQEALQQGITPEQLVKELQKQGITEQEAIQLVSAAMPQQEEMQQYQYGTTVRHNYADNINFDNKFNATALGLNAVSDPRNMVWALPDTGFGSGLKAISGLASGLAGSYLGYAKLFSDDKVTNNTPTATIGKNPNAQIQAPYKGTDSEKALPTDWGKGYDLPKELNPYDGNTNIQGTNQYSNIQGTNLLKKADPVEEQEKKEWFSQNPGKSWFDYLKEKNKLWTGPAYSDPNANVFDINNYEQFQKGGSKYGLNAYSKIQKEAMDKSLKEGKLSQEEYNTIKHHKSGLIKPYKDGWEYDMKNLYNSPNVKETTKEQQFFTEWYNNPITINKYDKYNIPKSMSINTDVIDNNIKTLNIKPDPDISNLYISDKGSYDPYAHTIWGMEKSRAHEVSHGSRIAHFPISQSIIQSILKNETHTQDPDNYYTDPDEVYARINSLRYKYNLKPGQIVTKEFLRNQLWQQELDDLKNHFTEKGILDLFNELAQNNNNKKYSNFNYAKKGGMKKYQWAGTYYDNPINRKTTAGLPIINNILPSENIDFNIDSLVPKTDPNLTIKSESWSNIQNPWLSQYSDNTNPNPPRIYTKDTVPNKIDRLTYQHYFPDATIDEGSIAMDDYQNKDINVNSNNQNNDLAITNNKPKSNSTITSMNDDALGFVIANNALIGFQNFNDVLSARDREKEYNQMLMKTGNSDQRYNPINPTNPYGMYTPNAGIGPNYGLVANSHIQDFGTSMASAKCGGMKKKYKEGGEYNLTQEEIDYILKNGGEIEMLD